MMTDRVSMMVEKGGTWAVHFKKFIALTSRNRNLTVCFFEGEDQKYYGIRLKLTSPKFNWQGIDCGGKKNVLTLHQLISKHETYQNSLVAFFVDRDFDELIPEKSRGIIYETPCYSIENLYCTEDCLREILTIEFKLDQNPEHPNLLNEAIDYFKELAAQFHIAIRPLNVWIKAQKKRESSLNLPNVSLDVFVQIKENEVTSIIDLSEISRKFPNSCVLSENEIQEEDVLFTTSDPHLNYRGKYELEFVRKYLEIQRAECKDKSSRFYNSGCAVKLSLSKGNFISELSQYATTPHCLSNFLVNLATQQAEFGAR